MTEPTDFVTAHSELSEFLVSNEETRQFNLNCEGHLRPQQHVLAPHSESDLLKIAIYCQKNRLAYSVFSGGNNWGYGTALSPQSTDILISLKSFNKILHFDEELGLVTIQAGVTQQILADFLKQKKSQWMLPTTGAGPTGTLIGNALERGFGLNPNADHFHGLQSLKVLLPNGETYQSSLTANGAIRSAQVSRWGTGPYIEGLFSQSNFGIVTEGQLNLAPRPLAVYLLVIKASEAQLPHLINCIQQLRREYPGFLNGINISNKERLNTTVYGQEMATSRWGEIFDKIAGLELQDYQAIIPISIYSPEQQNIPKQIFKKYKAQLSCKMLSENFLNTVGSFKIFNHPLFNNLQNKIKDAKELIQLCKGSPTNFALKLVYPGSTQLNTRSNPAHDGVGVLWFAPIIPLTAQDIQQSDKIFQQILPRFEQKVLVSLTNFDQRLCEATIPITFDPTNQTEVAKAYQCWDALYEASLAVGYSPYRFSIAHMDKTVHPNAAIGEMLAHFKRTIDPALVFASRRYNKV